MCIWVQVLMCSWTNGSVVPACSCVCQLGNWLRGVDVHGHVCTNMSRRLGAHMYMHVRHIFTSGCSVFTCCHVSAHAFPRDCVSGRSAIMRAYIFTYVDCQDAWTRLPQERKRGRHGRVRTCCAVCTCVLMCADMCLNVQFCCGTRPHSYVCIIVRCLEPNFYVQQRAQSYTAVESRADSAPRNDRALCTDTCSHLW